MVCEGRSLENRFAQKIAELVRFHLKPHLIIFWSQLKIAQRFNAGHSAFLFVESHRDDREFLSSLAGLDRHFVKPSVKTLGYRQTCAIAAKENFPFYDVAWLLSFSTVRDGF
jgi:hypothetical protein